MNIGLDARTVFSSQPRGTGRNLFDAYSRIPALRPDWRFTFYHRRRDSRCSLLEADAGLVEAGGGGSARWPDNVRLRLIDLPGDRWDAWFQVRLPLAAWADGLDLLHLPANAAPWWCPVPCVVTIHDLAPLKVQDAPSARARRRFLQGVRRGVRHARHIITPSRATRDELCAEFGVAAERITVIPWAPDRGIVTGSGRGREAGVLAAVRERYGLDRPWVLNFSGASRRKNALGLLAALRHLPAEVRQRHHWVLTGCNSAEHRAKLMAQAEALGVAADCRILGFVPHGDLPVLLRNAAALLMPSLHEGFGLPLLDAFACGVPVLTSRCSSMPEVAGDAAVYCDPTDARSIAVGIAQALEPKCAAELVRRGRERVREYTWERTARAMCEVYERAALGVRPVTAAVGREVPCR
jgi:glycosyltransferase involved in cell wall biosynthesis